MDEVQKHNLFNVTHVLGFAVSHMGEAMGDQIPAGK
jgi:hypothetical protein